MPNTEQRYVRVHPSQRDAMPLRPGTPALGDDGTYWSTFAVVWLSAACSIGALWLLGIIGPGPRIKMAHGRKKRLRTGRPRKPRC